MPSLTLLRSAKVINYTQVIMVLSLRMQLEVRLPGFYQPNETKKMFLYAKWKQPIRLSHKSTYKGPVRTTSFVGLYEVSERRHYTYHFFTLFLTRDQNNNDKSPIRTTSVDHDNNSNPSLMRCLANQHSATWSNKTGKRNKARAYKHRPEGPQL